MNQPFDVRCTCTNLIITNSTEIWYIIGNLGSEHFARTVLAAYLWCKNLYENV